MSGIPLSSNEKTIAELISVMESARDDGERNCRDLVRIHVGHICATIEVLKQMGSACETTRELAPSEAASFDKAFARSPRRVEPARDADHCDFPDCEQHWTYVLDMALAAMAKFHESFVPEDNPELTPCTTPKAFSEFVDEHARLMRIRASAPETPAEPCPACTEAHAQITDFGIGDGDIADRVGDLIERLCDCEISLGVFDPGAAAEYWLKYGTRAPEASPVKSSGECKDCEYYRSTGLGECKSCGASLVHCPKCKTALAFEGDECGLCKETES